MISKQGIEAGFNLRALQLESTLNNLFALNMKVLGPLIIDKYYINIQTSPHPYHHQKKNKSHPTNIVLAKQAQLLESELHLQEYSSAVLSS
jgi:hypothetical protein